MRDQIAVKARVVRPSCNRLPDDDAVDVMDAIHEALTAAGYEVIVLVAEVERDEVE